jgi:hypothetical protein
MPRGVTFDELLQQKLSPPPIDSRPAGTHGPAGMGAAYGFFFVEGARSSGSLTWAAGVAASHVAAVRPIRGAGHEVRGTGPRVFADVQSGPDRATIGESVRRTAPEPVHRLSPREQQALHTLISLGAQLTASFAFVELRSAFRELARRYHPDRHTGITDAEKSRLAGSFALAREAYRVLAERFRRIH